jgi:putative glutamine amidotransferase
VSTRPRIGITCSPLRVPTYYDTYLRAIEQAGGEPVRIRPLSDDDDPQAHVAELMGSIDGMLFPGGWDVDPPRYGEAREQETPDVDPALDHTEIALARAAADAQLPMFGICRGQQLINVALGGTLHQHIDGHDMHSEPRNTLAHRIDIDASSELARATGTPTLQVNSLHHQAVKQVAPGLRVTARSTDGTVEGIESGDGRVVAVQCHPEELVSDLSWAQTLFQAFVERSGRAVATGAPKEAPTG